MAPAQDQGPVAAAVFEKTRKKHSSHPSNALANHRYVAGNAIVNLETAGRANEAYAALGEKVLDKKKLIGERGPVVAQQVVSLAERLVKERYTIDATNFDDTIFHAVGGALADVMRDQMAEYRAEMAKALKREAITDGKCKAFERRLASMEERLRKAAESRMEDRKSFGEQLAVLKNNAKNTRDILGQNVTTENVQRAAESAAAASRKVEELVNANAKASSKLHAALNDVKTSVQSRNESAVEQRQQLDAEITARNTDRAHQGEITQLQLTVRGKERDIEELKLRLEHERQSKQAALDTSSGRYAKYDEWTKAQILQLENRDKQYMAERRRADELSSRVYDLESELRAVNFDKTATTIVQEIGSYRVENFQQQIELHQHEITLLNETITTTKAQLARERGTCDELRKEAALERGRAAELIGTELERLKRDHDKLESGTLTRQEHQDAMTKAHDDMKAYTKSLHDTKDDAAANHTKTIALIEQMFALLGDKQKLEAAATLHASQLENKEAEYKAALAKRDQEWTERLSELRLLHEKERVRLSEDITKVEQQLLEEQRKHGETQSTLDLTLSEIKNRATAHATALRQLEDQLTAVHEEKEREARELANLNLAEMQRALDDATAINETRGKRIEALEISAANDDKTITALTEDRQALTKLTAEHEALTSSETDTRKKNGELTSNLQTLELTVAQLREELGSSEERLEGQKTALDDYKTQLDQLFTDNAGMTSGQQQDANRIQMLEQEIEVLNSNVGEVIKQRNVLSSQKAAAVKELGGRIVAANDKIQEVKSQGKKWYDEWQSSLKQRTIDTTEHARVIGIWKAWGEERKSQIYQLEEDRKRWSDKANGAFQRIWPLNKQIERQGVTIAEQLKALDLEKAAKKKIQDALDTTLESLRELEHNDFEAQQQIFDLEMDIRNKDLELAGLREFEQEASYLIQKARNIASGHKADNEQKIIALRDAQHIINGMTEELNDVHREVNKLYRELGTAMDLGRALHAEAVNPALP